MRKVKPKRNSIQLSNDYLFLPPKKKNENNFIRHRSYFHSFFWWQGDVGCLWEIASAFGCPYLIRSNFIKTTYDISLDSWISFLPLGFSPTLKEKTENPKVRKEMESRFATLKHGFIFVLHLLGWKDIERSDTNKHK